MLKAVFALLFSCIWIRQIRVGGVLVGLVLHQFDLDIKLSCRAAKVSVDALCIARERVRSGCVMT